MEEIPYLRSLDLSQNTNLESVNIKFMELNQLRLDNGNNTAISYINLLYISRSGDPGGNDPICVQVDDADYSTVNWTTNKDDPREWIDATITFSEDCGY